MKLLDFYKRVLESMGLTVSDDGYVKVGSGKDAIMLTADGKPMVLPTPEHINSLVSKNEEGKYVATKIPYNPLNENVIKGDSISIKKTKTIVERKLGHSIAALGEMLLQLASNSELQKNTSLELNKFLAKLNMEQSNGVKNIVDDKSIDLWSKMYANTLKASKGMVSIYLKKAGVYKGVKYNRLATATFPVYEELLEGNKNVPISGVKLRNKDLHVFKALFEYILTGLDENHKIVYGSNDGESPAFISLFTLYIKIGNRVNKLAKALKFVSEKSSDHAHLPIKIKLSDLDNIIRFKSELAVLPGDTDVIRAKADKEVGNSRIGGMSIASTMNKDKISVPPWESNVAANTNVGQQSSEDEDLVRKILYGNGNVNPVAVPPIVPQQQQPYGMQQTQYQQPYQQPIQQVPLYGQQVSQVPMPQTAMMGQPATQAQYQQPMQQYNQMQQYPQQQQVQVPLYGAVNQVAGVTSRFS